MEKLNVTADNLNKVLGLSEQPIEVHEDGTVTRADEYSPELSVGTDETMQILSGDEDALSDLAESQGWELLTGWTGQYGYSGAIMHASEYIGGRLAEYILETPGIYTAVVVEVDDPEIEEPAGWAIARKL